MESRKIMSQVIQFRLHQRIIIHEFRIREKRTHLVEQISLKTLRFHVAASEVLPYFLMESHIRW